MTHTWPTVPGLARPVQLAYAVPDAVEAARRWARDLGAGPFLVRPHIPLARVEYRGAPGEFDHTSAYGQWGSLMVELVQVHGTTPNVVNERFAPHESGLHHVAYIVDDLAATSAALTARGHATAMSAWTSSGLQFDFVDTVAEFGHMLELYERNEHLVAFYARVADAAIGWDGSDPVRVI